MTGTIVSSQPWLSVLVPVYRVEPYLERCVESVIRQGVDGIEILLLDDASPDRCGEIAAMLQERHPGSVRVLTHPVNRGLSAARNSLLAEARGRYIWFLDSDDELLPNAVDGLLRIVEASAPDLVLCDFRVVREHTTLRHRLRGELHRPSFSGATRAVSSDRNLLVTGLLESRQLHAWSKIAKREVWLQAPFPEGRYFEDMAVVALLVGATESWQHAAAPWVGYRQRGDSIVATMTAAKALDVLDALRDLHRGLTALPDIDRNARAALDYFCLRSFSMLARKLPRGNEAAEDACRKALADIFPGGVRSTLDAWRRRGWRLRAWRAQRSLSRRGWLTT